MEISVLGCSGGIGGDRRTTSFLLNDHTLIDAGTGVGDLSLDQLLKIDQVFLTHAHLDHCCMLPMLIDAGAGIRTKPIEVHANAETIAVLSAHMFNNKLWPDFTSIPSKEAPFVRLNTLAVDDEISLDPVTTLHVLPANHSVPAVGYGISTFGKTWIFTGDTKGSPIFWEKLNQLPAPTWLVIETSFTNQDHHLANVSGHLCPDSLIAQLDQLSAGCHLVITHLKPGEEEAILEELQATNPLIGDITAIRSGFRFELTESQADIIPANPSIGAEWLDELNKIGTDLSAEKDLATLLERILIAAKTYSNADGGTVYRLIDNHLKFETVLNDSLGFAMGGTTGKAISFPPIALSNNGVANHHHVVAHAALTGQTINIEDAYTADGYDFSGTKAFDERTGYRSRSFLTVPMKDHDGQVIGVLQLINARYPDSGRIIGFSHAVQRQVESLASQAAIALGNRLLIDQLEMLFESLINLINQALDEKSPYTGGHCARVPELTMQLANATANVDYGPYQSFSLDAKDKYELKIASLLHDCGKITTPVHVVDKSTKLETIYDRIEEVNRRFDIASKELELQMLRGNATEAETNSALAALENDRQFINQTNRGGEWLSDEAVQRITQIASRTWHDAAGNAYPILTENEVNNLSVRKGTLTDEERQIINHHINVTINMLEALPWPPHLARVPEFAGGHHERMDGKGYPKGLTKEEMSVQARMMGIADIFEALTAADRPYKPGLKLSVALTILGKMCKDQHIDPDLFEIFVKEKVYLSYAEMFLPPHQIDEVNIDLIPGWSGFQG
ncbi:GAF domain-containing protein [Leeia sp. TBRC 13508]|uniref:GAF domain-containing protein n=1 Tax=Leeia speluncae TaxID=2884804 RepID=A0ABS8D6N4_9NEIS|nr:HD domain-containing phosphohydrolase [Leeia speluncae]MCB6183860.1 GAF domain-containing protein [Leeia speluncae]